MMAIPSRKLLRRAVLMLMGLHAAGAAASPQSPAWILVDTHTLTLTVRSSQDRVLARFQNISIGSGGAASMRRAGDSTTPLGTFHVAWVNRRSPFHIFFGLDYPTATYGERAYRLGVIDKATYDAIHEASRNGKIPPQDTSLGGGIGIHGLGGGDPAVQRKINWTDGCIAVSNAATEKLSRWIHPGTTVVIR